jgi:hypothetical protein
MSHIRGKIKQNSENLEDLWGEEGAGDDFMVRFPTVNLIHSNAEVST